MNEEHPGDERGASPLQPTPLPDEATLDAERRSAEIDQASADSFPASDPPSFTDSTATLDREGDE